MIKTSARKIKPTDMQIDRDSPWKIEREGGRVGVFAFESSRYCFTKITLNFQVPARNLNYDVQIRFQRVPTT